MMPRNQKQQQQQLDPWMMLYVCANVSVRSLCYPNPEYHQHVPGLPQPLPERQVYPHAGYWISL